MMFEFVDGATGSEIAERRNREALAAIDLASRVLVDVEQLSTTTTLFGREYGVPFGIAPTGMCNLIWPGADQALSHEAKARRLPHCVSTAASTALQETARLNDGGAWFQLYAGSDEETTEEFLARAETAGYEVLVFTADTPRLSRRVRDIRNGFQVPFRTGVKEFIDFATHPHWSIATLLAGTPKPMNFATSKVQKKFVRDDSRGGADWTFLDRLRARWKGKLVVKGVMSVDDAVRIRDAGADAVYVSNHGGRQLDSAPPAIEALPKIRTAVGPDFPLIFDSGVRSADDMVRALALGANFVMLGRPSLYALGADGHRGLATLMDTLEDDLKAVMAQIGVTSIAQINTSVLSGQWRNPT